MFSDFSFTKFVRLLLIVLALAAILFISYTFLDILIMLTISLLLAFIFNPIVSYLSNKGISRFVAILFVAILNILFLFILLSFIIPKLSYQINTLSSSFTQDNYKKFLTGTDQFISNYMPFVKKGTISTKLENFFSSLLLDSVDRISNVVSSLVSLIAILVIVPFMTFFLLKDNKTIIKGIVNIMPNKYFEMSYWIIRKISIQLGRFVRGWILDAFIVGLLSAVGLSILGIDNAVPIGVIAGIGHLIPYFGPIVGGVPAIFISAFQLGNFSMLPYIIILFIIIYTIDNGFIQPNVFSKSVDMHPLLIIILIIAGSQLMGILGMLLAVPTATVLKTAARETYYGYKNYQIIKS